MSTEEEGDGEAFSRFHIQTLSVADMEGTSGKTNPGIVDRVHYRQLLDFMAEPYNFYSLSQTRSGQDTVKASPTSLHPKTCHLKLLKY
jgi:hypothetical protein